MAVFKLAPIIKNRREELGLTQEELADGICSVPTLSRIENGERLPSKNHLEMLLQRLGYSEMFCDCFTDNREFRIHELKIKIRQSYMAQRIQEAKDLLKTFEELMDSDSQIDRQFDILYQTLLNKPMFSLEERLQKFEQALQLTCAKYKSESIPQILSYAEIILLNNIAIGYNESGNNPKAISILFTVMKFYSKEQISTEEALRTQPMVLYNLSKFLGEAGRYDECIEISNLCIRIARESGKCTSLGRALFNCAWAHLMRNDIGDRDAAKLYLKRAYNFADIMDNHADAEFINEFYSANFKEVLMIKD